jgi:UDP-N-acetylmuramoylalanine--D-glutamate ligase
MIPRFKSVATLREVVKAPNADFCSKEELKKSIKANSLVVSPGFPLKDELIQFYKGQGALITSEINLATYFLTTEKIVGITGSLGKSTTTSLIGAGLRSFDSHAFVGGNLGTPFCEWCIGFKW